MRLVGLVSIGAVVAMLVVFGVQAGTDAPAAIAPTVPVASAEVAEPLPATPTEADRADEVAETVIAEAAQFEEPTRVTVAPPAPPARRRSYRRRPPRYPDPPGPDDWEPPDGPVRIALQAGHWRADEAPRELRGLRNNGTRWRETAEWEVNLEIVQRAGAMLEEMGYEVDILPAVVPPAYRAHLFIAIHADGSNDPNASGYRVAAPRRDATGKASQVAALLAQSYGEATGIKRLPTITRRMRNYYAFNFQRYEHALHPMTIAIILETGFLTSRRDRQVLVNDPDRAARGIVAAVTAFSVTPPPVIVDEETSEVSGG
ncbi:MAG: N-acetylmuramoyl-L-alanine amidase [Gemmatimonadetes bacterium]|nr:N-acetylmuramoyl-L-alanine amidase [Gemmatimonadota bacterium]